MGGPPVHRFVLSVSVGAPDGAKDAFLAPLPGLTQTKKNETLGLSFSHGSRHGLFSIVPSALKVGRVRACKRAPYGP